jgi:hypothetical protein
MARRTLDGKDYRCYATMQLAVKDIANSINFSHIEFNTADPLSPFTSLSDSTQEGLLVPQNRFSTARPVTRLPRISPQDFLETPIEVKHL